MHNIFVFITFILLIYAYSAHGVEFDCPKRCTCFQTTVRCIRLNLNKIPKIPLNTTILDLRFNQFRDIPSRAFEGLNQTHTILLSDNGIEYINQDTFKGLLALKNLYLNNNHLSEIPKNAFLGLKQLEGLYLENNDIWELEKFAFSSLFKLTRLFLYGNKLSSIPKGLFDDLISLRRLRLENNPINCDCGVEALLSMQKNAEEPIFISLICEAPENLHKKNFSTLQENDFHCKKPQMTEEPHDMEIAMGEMIELPCSAIGDPQPEVVWIHNTNEISDNYAPRVEVLQTGKLRIASVDKNDVGIYECIARNENGEAKSQPIRMVINDNGNHLVAPEFIYKPKDMVISLDDYAVLHCFASGLPTPVIKWFFNGRLLSQSSLTTRILSNGSLEISGATSLVAGTYRCEASNDLGSIKAEANVDVKELPVFILAPQTQTVKKGQIITLECDAEGNPLPTITWYFNDKPIISNKRISLENENTECVIKDAKTSDSGNIVLLINIFIITICYF